MRGWRELQQQVEVQMSDPQRIPGEALADRLLSRLHARPRIGTSPAFFLRLGIPDPWCMDGGEAPEQGNVFGPWAHMWLRLQRYLDVGVLQAGDLGFMVGDPWSWLAGVEVGGARWSRPLGLSFVHVLPLTEEDTPPAPRRWPETRYTSSRRPQTPTTAEATPPPPTRPTPPQAPTAPARPPTAGHAGDQSPATRAEVTERPGTAEPPRAGALRRPRPDEPPRAGALRRPRPDEPPRAETLRRPRPDEPPRAEAHRAATTEEPGRSRPQPAGLGPEATGPSPTSRLATARRGSPGALARAAARSLRPNAGGPALRRAVLAASAEEHTLDAYQPSGVLRRATAPGRSRAPATTPVARAEARIPGAPSTSILSLPAPRAGAIEPARRRMRPLLGGSPFLSLALPPTEQEGTSETAPRTRGAPRGEAPAQSTPVRRRPTDRPLLRAEPAAASDMALGQPEPPSPGPTRGRAQGPMAQQAPQARQMGPGPGEPAVSRPSAAERMAQAMGKRLSAMGAAALPAASTHHQGAGLAAPRSMAHPPPVGPLSLAGLHRRQDVAGWPPSATQEGPRAIEPRSPFLAMMALLDSPYHGEPSAEVVPPPLHRDAPRRALARLPDHPPTSTLVPHPVARPSIGGPARSQRPPEVTRRLAEPATTVRPWARDLTMPEAAARSILPPEMTMPLRAGQDPARGDGAPDRHMWLPTARLAARLATPLAEAAGERRADPHGAPRAYTDKRAPESRRRAGDPEALPSPRRPAPRVGPAAELLQSVPPDTTHEDGAPRPAPRRAPRAAGSWWAGVRGGGDHGAPPERSADARGDGAGGTSPTDNVLFRGVTGGIRGTPSSAARRFQGAEPHQDDAAPRARHLMTAPALLEARDRRGHSSSPRGAAFPRPLTPPSAGERSHHDAGPRWSSPVIPRHSYSTPQARLTPQTPLAHSVPGPAHGVPAPAPSALPPAFRMLQREAPRTRAHRPGGSSSPAPSPHDIQGRTSLQRLLAAISRAHGPDAVLMALMDQPAWVPPDDVHRFISGETGYTPDASPPTAPMESLRSPRQRAAARPAQGAPSPTSAGRSHLGRIARLAQKLKSLIHLVDVDHQLSAARQQVRMAEDTAEARAEGSGQEPLAAAALDSTEALDALTREVMDLVSGELRARKERTLGCGDGLTCRW